ncbi:hypothetical protein K435DRAFT_275732 [Dendrothele bispora CBS 962.96]|uniref:Uncharacterized protein n=1 Tax=Dendrothele bispora (strain CBS 962.96) TaxID=1314807 RepID=A0A4S8LLG5_DENBC|nr:hypothetical protein K435DRAFT_275732 [Dendrothele bispora CBS 962.96]
MKTEVSQSSAQAGTAKPRTRNRKPELTRLSIPPTRPSVEKEAESPLSPITPSSPSVPHTDGNDGSESLAKDGRLTLAPEAEAGPGPTTLAIRASSSLLFSSVEPQPPTAVTHVVEGLTSKTRTRTRPEKDAGETSGRIRPYPARVTRATKGDGGVQGEGEVKGLGKEKLEGKGKGKGKGKEEAEKVVTSTESETIAKTRRAGTRLGPTRTRMKVIKTTGTDGSWDGKEMVAERETEKDSRRAVSSEEMNKDVEITGESDGNTSRVVSGDSQQVRRSTRTRRKSAKLRLADEEENEAGAELERVGAGRGKGMNEGAKEREREKRTRKKSSEGQGRGSEEKLGMESNSGSNPAIFIPNKIPRSRSPSHPQTTGSPSLLSPPSRPSPLLKSSSSSSESSSSTSVPGRAASFQFPVHSQALRLDMSLEKIAGMGSGPGLERAERVETPESSTLTSVGSLAVPQHQQQMAIAPDTVKNVIVVDVPSSTASSPLISPSLSPILSGVGQKVEDEEDEAHHSAPDPMFPPLSPTTDEVISPLRTLSPSLSVPASRSVSPTQSDKGDADQEHTPIPPDPLFQVPSASHTETGIEQSFPWSSSSVYNAQVPGLANRASSPTPSTIAPSSPYLSPAEFPSDRILFNDDGEEIGPAYLPLPVNSANYCILVNKLSPFSPLFGHFQHQHMPEDHADQDPSSNASHQSHPQSQSPLSLPLSQRFYIYRPHPKPPCTSPPLFNPCDIAREDLSPYPPHKWLTSFDPKFASMDRERGGGMCEHQHGGYMECDLDTEAFGGGQGKVKFSIGSEDRGENGPEPHSMTTRGKVGGRSWGAGQVSGRNMTWAWQKMYMDFRLKKSSMRALGPVEIEGTEGVVDMELDDEVETETERPDQHNETVEPVSAGESEEDTKNVVVHSQHEGTSRQRRKTRKEEMEDENPLRKKMAFGPKSNTSSYLTEWFESGVEGL